MAKRLRQHRPEACCHGCACPARADDSPAPDPAVRDRVPDHRRGAADDRLRARAPQHRRRRAARPPAGAATCRRPSSRGFPPPSASWRSRASSTTSSCTSALHRLLAEYLLALGVMTMLSVGAGWLLAGRALAPLREITATARRVSGENLGERISLSGPADELKELADTFDGMLGRLDARVRQPAPLRGQRLARAAHAAGDHAHRGRRRTGRPGRAARGASRRWARR